MSTASAGTADTRLTLTFAEQLLELSSTEGEPRLQAHAQSHLLNALALAVGASDQPAVQGAIRLGSTVGGRPTAPVPGTRTVLDAQYAALATGVGAHLDDFDDTHLATVIHPSATTMAAALALGVTRGVDGSTLLRAFTLGCEAQLRVGLALGPSHYDAGWHITGTCGVLGAAVAGGVVVGLDAPRLAMAIGIAASSTVGQREGFGTMLKALHTGKAAANGVLAVLLAESGFTGSSRVLEAPRGFLSVFSNTVDQSQVLTELGSTWAFSDNTVKPYPCGIVIHPVIDAGLELSQRIPNPWQISAVTVRCNPLVTDLTGITQPQDGLQARFSAAHGLAAALIDGSVGLPAYTTKRVQDSQLAHLRQTISLAPDPMCPRDAASVTVSLTDGRSLVSDIVHARGSQSRPLSAGEVRAKAEALIRPLLGERADQLPAAVETLPSAGDLVALVNSLTPTEEIA